MRIGIDGTTLCDPSGSRGAGIEHYTWSIVSELIKQGSEHQFFLFVPSCFSAMFRRQLTEGATNVKFISIPRPRIIWITRHVLLPLRMKLQRLDVLFAPAGQLPLGWRGSSVTTVHDVSILAHPEWFPESLGQDISAKVYVPRSLRRTDRIIAVSDATKQQLAEQFPETVQKIEVIHEGVDVPEPAQLPGVEQKEAEHDLVLFLGTIEPRKNLLNAFHAFHQFLMAHPERVGKTRFVLAGKAGWKFQDVQEAIVDLNHVWRKRAPEGVVEHIGYVTEQEKWNVLRRASVLFFPSYEEGFGLPVLEAMATETPVITTPCPAIREVAGDCVLYCEPEDVEAMSLALAQCLLVPDGTTGLVDQAKNRADQLTWKRAAQKTLKVLESIWTV